MKKFLFVFAILIGVFCVDVGYGTDQTPEQVLSNNLTAAIDENGKQPNLETCKKESFCLWNIDPKIGFSNEVAKRGEITNVENFINETTDLVTKWYLQQFLLSPKENGNEQLARNAGLDPNIPIINFEFTEKFGLRQAEQGIKTLQAQSTTANQNISFFLDSFYKIASNPIGRMLLYRLLIEIYRSDGNKNGCMGNDLYYEINSQKKQDNVDKLIYRNKSRNVSIDFHSYPKYQKVDHLNSSAKIFLPSDVEYYKKCKQSLLEKFNLICNITDKLTEECLKNVYLIEEGDREAFIILFHEMVHWFHSLRDYQRSINDSSGKGENTADLKFLDPNTLGGYYYKDLSLNDLHNKSYTTKMRINNSMKLWVKVIGFTKLLYRHEEHRTICGSPIDLKGIYLNGDELSENMLVASINNNNIKFRLGHGEEDPKSGVTYTCYEDEEVVKKIVNVASLSDISYNKSGSVLTCVAESININEIFRKFKRGLGNYVFIEN